MDKQWDKFTAAYRAYEKARKMFETWARNVIARRAYSDKAKGKRLARDLERKHKAFMAAGEPFTSSKKR